MWWLSDRKRKAISKDLRNYPDFNDDCTFKHKRRDRYLTGIAYTCIIFGLLLLLSVVL